MSCPFCDIDSLKERIFYANEKWFAFLAAPFHTKGHAIIAERSCFSLCPRIDRRGWGDLHCFGATLGEVATTLTKHYNPKDILFISLRGNIHHFHVHLIPLWAKDEGIWRKNKGDRYQKGHLMEFLGNLEKEATKRAERDRTARGITKDQQRQEITKALKPEVEKLRNLTGYSGMV